MKLVDGKFKLTKRSCTFVAALALVLIAVGLAVTIGNRNPAVKANVQIQTPPGIEIYLDAGLTQVANFIGFGAVAVDPSGNVVNQSAVPVWVQNSAAVPVRLTLADDFPSLGIRRRRYQ